MSSPFPGMDPYLEAQGVFPDLHTSLMTQLKCVLLPVLRPRYSVRTERRIYVETREGSRAFGADVALTDGDRPASPSRPRTVPLTAEPVPVTLPMPQERREVYVVIRHPEEETVVTVIEVLSPWNKRPGSDGRRIYIRKRRHILGSLTNLVEIDLLRAGQRPPTETALPACDYCAMVSREAARPRADAYCWSLRDRLPTIPVPLADADPEVPLDLQAAFDATYDSSDYSYTIRYDRPPDPPLCEADTSWAANRIALWRQIRP